MSGRGRGVKGHSPSRPDGEVLTQEPEEMWWAVLPLAGMSPVLGCLSQGVVPHLHTRGQCGKPVTQLGISTSASSAVRCDIRVGTGRSTVAGVTMARRKSHTFQMVHKQKCHSFPE